MINIENATIDTRELAAMFDTTPRNILHIIDNGMPVYSRGKAGKDHVFKLPWALYWHAGWKTCRVWREKTPGPLETVLIGYALDNEYDGFSFEDWMHRARTLATDMGHSSQAFDQAVQYVISHGLIRWSKRRF